MAHFPSIPAVAPLLFTLLYAGCGDDGPRAEEFGREAERVEADSASWVALFDGNDLSAWRGLDAEEPPGSWELRGGALVLRPDSEGAGDLVTRETFETFDLRFEFRLSECANSGVVYGVDLGGEATWHTGPEYQLLDDDCENYASVDSAQHTASAYDLFPAVDAALRPAGMWNEGRIVVEAGQVEHWLNGEEVLEYERSGPRWDRAVAASKFTQWPAFGKTIGGGHVALQDHGSEVAFRNIRIRPLAD